MGYLQDFRKRFAKRLEDLDPEAMKLALNEACDAILESYRNGQKSRQNKGQKKGQNNGNQAKRSA